MHLPFLDCKIPCLFLYFPYITKQGMLLHPRNWFYWGLNNFTDIQKIDQLLIKTSLITSINVETFPFRLYLKI